MDDTNRRLLAYPIAAVIVGGLSWLAFGYRAEADFMTLVQSASIHAQLGASIPADTKKPDMIALRQKLLREAREWLARAEAVEPGTAAGMQVEAFLAMTDGHDREAATLFRRCRSAHDVTSDQLGELNLREAQALSNATDFKAALGVLDEKVSPLTEEVALARESLRLRVLVRAGRGEDAQRAAEAMVDSHAEGSEGCRVAASMLEGLGAWSAAEAGWRKGETDPSVEEYQVARLKLRSGHAEEARELLTHSVTDRNPEILRRLANDRQMWEATFGAEDVGRLLETTTATPATVGR